MVELAKTGLSKTSLHGIICEVFIILVSVVVAIIITGAPSQSQRALQQTLAGKVIVGEGHHS